MIQVFKTNGKAIKRDMIIILVIILSPLLIYFYQLFPIQVKFYENALIRLESNYYQDIQAMVYITSIKVVFIIIYSIWYITSKNWWKSIIILPLFFSIYQLVLVVNGEVRYIDGFKEFILALVLSFPFVLGLIFLSKKLNYYKESNVLKENINKEIDDLVLDISKFKTNDFLTIKEEILNLRHQKEKHKKEDYLIKLIKLRDELYNL